MDPGRLNIDSDAKDYGLIKPCRSFINFYIAQNTPIKSAVGRVTVFENKTKLESYEFRFTFNEPESGLLRHSFAIPDQENYSCEKLNVSIDSLRCQAGNTSEIACPAVRLKTSLVFDDLRLDKSALDVCYDS